LTSIFIIRILNSILLCKRFVITQEVFTSPYKSLPCFLLSCIKTMHKIIVFYNFSNLRSNEYTFFKFSCTYLWKFFLRYWNPSIFVLPMAITTFFIKSSFISIRTWHFIMKMSYHSSKENAWSARDVKFVRIIDQTSQYYSMNRIFYE